jgi:ubiquinone/menaquinone biosynthesis C-methylase UbiE
MTPTIDTGKLTRWYDFQAPFYRLWRNRYDAPLVTRTISIIRDGGNAGCILDAGCGTGLFSVAVADAFPASRVVGIDMSTGMLEVARTQARDRSQTNVRFSRADVAALPFDPDAFDVVVAAGLLPNVNDPMGVVRELARVVRTGGRVVVVEFDRQRMNLGTRLFFHTMILGYRCVSFLFRRFRFADNWSLRSSTIDRADLERSAAQAGLRILSTDRLEGHLIFELGKGDSP